MQKFFDTFIDGEIINQIDIKTLVKKYKFEKKVATDLFERMRKEITELYQREGDMCGKIKLRSGIFTELYKMPPSVKGIENSFDIITNLKQIQPMFLTPKLIEINPVLPNFEIILGLYKKYGHLNYSLLFKEGMLNPEREGEEEGKRQ
jgi:hypothetical protein